MSAPVIEVKDLFFSYTHNYWELQDIEFTIREGDFIGIIGPNGGGKSTLLKLLLGLYKPQSGDIKLFGKTVKKGRRDVGYFPQIRNVDTEFPITVEEVVLSSRLGSKVMNFISGKDRKIVKEILEKLDILDLKDRKLDELSGGQRNRVFLGRALASEPKLLILDEPMAGLDIELQRKFVEILKILNKKLTILIVDHNVELLEDYVDSFICLNRCLAHKIQKHEKGHLESHHHQEHTHKEDGQ